MRKKREEEVGVAVMIATVDVSRPSWRSDAKGHQFLWASKSAAAAAAVLESKTQNYLNARARGAESRLVYTRRTWTPQFAEIWC